MPDTPRPEGETANMLRQAAYALAEKRWRERQAAMPKGAMQVGCDCVTYKEVRLIEAELRAALLSGAPTVWVATDSGASVSDLADALGIPPGTVRRYALVPLEEEGRDG